MSRRVIFVPNRSIKHEKFDTMHALVFFFLLYCSLHRQHYYDISIRWKRADFRPDSFQRSPVVADQRQIVFIIEDHQSKREHTGKYDKLTQFYYSKTNENLIRFPGPGRRGIRTDSFFPRNSFDHSGRP